MEHQNKLRLNKYLKREEKLSYWLLLPAMIIIVFILIVPSLMSVKDSFFSWNLLKAGEKAFTFLNNFKILFHDQTFQRSVVFTFLFISVTIVIEIILGMLAALIVISLPAFFRKLTTTALFIPYMLSPLTVGLIWKLLFTYDGLINGILLWLNIEPVAWMVNPGSAFVACTIAEIWRSYPFGFLLLLSTLSTIPIEPYEAAKVDGASRLETFYFITLPFCKPTVVIILIYQIVLKLRLFDLVYLLTAGGPVDYTTPLGLLIYKYYFRYYEAGLGSATAVFVLICSIVISILVIKNLYKDE